ncbi:DUF6233 domain-containing protein [Streptomyces sp. NPDC005989]|uniref:DUF6233 domain-containing protein n=1 Tax=Streptomyces sp. NPDC005989 TaxID=3156727 RepID=UPI0033D08A76
MCLHTVDAAIAAGGRAEARQGPGGIGQSAPPTEVHVGGCHMTKNARGVTREQALQALVAGVRACIRCRPDTELGILE